MAAFGTTLAVADCSVTLLDDPASRRSACVTYTRDAVGEAGAVGTGIIPVRLRNVVEADGVAVGPMRVAGLAELCGPPVLDIVSFESELSKELLDGKRSIAVLGTFVNVVSLISGVGTAENVILTVVVFGYRYVLGVDADEKTLSLPVNDMYTFVVWVSFERPPRPKLENGLASCVEP